MTEPIRVSSEEAGQKLLSFLERRFTVPRSVLHRWIRSGQVRINGGRAKAFDRVDKDALIRVPPFAEADARIAEKTDTPQKNQNIHMAKNLSVVAESEDLVIFCKPSGLPVHPGTGHQDCVTARIAKIYADAAFMPTPAHRLDRDTSGLLLVAKTYVTLRRFSDAFAGKSDETICKEYLAWVHGDCPWSKPCRLQDTLLKEADGSGQERIVVQSQEENGKKAELSVVCLRRGKKSSLVHVRLHTGRTHQIRVQLAARGFPLVGDLKYGGPPCPEGMKLHAARITVSGMVYESLPQWSGDFGIDRLPPFPDTMNTLEEK